MVETKGQKKAEHFTLVPISGAPTDNNSIYVDSADSNKLKLKDNAGASAEIGAGGGASGTIVSANLTATELEGNASVTLFTLPADASLSYIHFHITTAGTSGQVHSGIGIDTDTTKYLAAGNLDSTGVIIVTSNFPSEILSSTVGTDVKIYGNALGTWSAGGALPAARESGAMAGVITASFYVGGNNAGAQDDTYEYDGTSYSAGGLYVANTQELSATGTLTAGLAFGGAANTTTTQEYDGTVWTAGGALNTGRELLTGAGTQTAGLSIGGNDTSTSVVTEEYDGATWAGGGSLSGARERHGSFGTQTDALASCGLNGTAIATSESYNGTAWSGETVNPQAREQTSGTGNSTGQSNGLIVAGSTDTTDANVVTSVHSYDGSAWTAMAGVSTARHFHSSTGDGSKALCSGGINSASAILSSTEEFYLGFGPIGSGDFTVTAKYNTYS